MFKDWNFWLSLISVSIALVAIYLSLHQIMLSNKQCLFDRRLKVYMTIKGLIKLCEDNFIVFKAYDDNNIEYANAMHFSFLVNNSYLQECANIMNHTLEKPYHQEFLTKLEELRMMGEESIFIFSGKKVEICREFIFSYADVLSLMYGYQIMLKNIEEEKKKEPLSSEQIQALFNEKEDREKVKDALNRLDEKCKEIKEIEDEIRKQIYLVKVG